jgi:CSLREA domain-containing protein
MNRGRKALAAATVVIASLLFAQSASANSILVNTAADEFQTNPSACSLREAIVNANTDVIPTNGCLGGSGHDFITFAGSLTNATLNLTNADTGYLQISTSMTITGPGMNQLTVNAPSANRALLVTSSAGQVSLSGLSIENGAVAGDDQANGGGILSNATSLTLTDVKVDNNTATAAGVNPGDTTALGGGIYATGGLTLDHSVISNNRVDADNPLLSDGEADASGGGVAAVGLAQLTQIKDSTIDGNLAAAQDEHGAAPSNAAGTFGGGLSASGDVTVERSTVSNNSANADSSEGPAFAQGAGVDLSSATATIELSTIADNETISTGVDGPSSFQAGGGIAGTGGTLNLESNTIAANGPAAGSDDGANLSPAVGGTKMYLQNTLVALPRGATSTNCDAAIVSLGFNYDDSGTCDLNSVDDFPGFAPVLAGSVPVGNGGPTKTIALLPSAPVIDQGSNTGQTDSSHDQRGLVRPVDSSSFPNLAGGTDIGAFEAQAPPAPTLAATSPASPSNDPSPEVTGTLPSGPSPQESANGVTVYQDAGCATGLGGGSATDFTGLGISATVPHNATTTVYAAAANAYGIRSSCSSSFLTYQHDDAPPVLTIDSGPSDASDHMPTFTFHATDASPPIAYQCSVDTGTPSFSPCTSPFTASSLPDGSYTFRVSAQDSLLNPAAVATQPFAITTPAPPTTTPPSTTAPSTTPPGKKKCKRAKKRAASAAKKKCKKKK